MITWNKQFKIALPFSEVDKLITISDMQYFFPNVIVNNYLAEQSCYKQTVQVLNKQISYLLYCTDLLKTETKSMQAYRAIVREQVEVIITFVLEALNANTTAVTYTGSITPLTPNKPLKIGLTAIRRQILTSVVTNPIQRMIEL